MSNKIKKDKVIDWLCMHRQAFKDFFDAGLDIDSDITEIVGWIAEHDQLFEDFTMFFFDN